MIDTLDLKRSVDLLVLTSRDTHLKRVSGTRGGEFAGACPKCGGRDRFRVQPEQGLAYCRHCMDRWVDAIGYIQWRDGVSFTEACRVLGAPNAVPTPTAPPRPPKPPIPAPADDPEPTSAWRTAAAEVVERCKSALWTDAGAKARAWLHGRGLDDETIATWHLGYCPRDQSIGGLWVQRGIAIPWLLEGELWMIKIRRPMGDPKYVSVRGGHPALYGTVETLDGYPAAALVEGELDLLLLWQEARDLLGVVTLGSCSKTLTPRAVRYLLPVPDLLVAYDADDPGEEGASKLCTLSSRMRRIRPPVGKDLGEFWQQGGSLRDWIAFHLAAGEAPCRS